MKPDIAVVSEITEVETIAVGRAIREIERLRKMYGQGRWRKLKGVALVQPGVNLPLVMLKVERQLRRSSGS